MKHFHQAIKTLQASCNEIPAKYSRYFESDYFLNLPTDLMYAVHENHQVEMSDVHTMYALCRSPLAPAEKVRQMGLL